MNNNGIKELSLRLTQVAHDHTDFIDGDVLLVDRMNRALMPTSPHRLTFILVALCTSGECRFTIDTQQFTIKKNDLVIISDRHIVDSFSATDDADGLVMMLSVNFFYEIVRNVSDVSTLFCFSRSHPVVSLEDREVELFSSYFYFLKEKIGDPANKFRRNIVGTLILVMFYDLSNVILRVQEETHNKKQTRAESIFTKKDSEAEKADHESLV